MKTRIRTLLSIALLSLGLSTAHATTLGFDDLPGTTLPIPNGYNGFNWQNFLYLNVITGITTNSGYRNGVVSSPNVAFSANARPASFSDASPGTFTLNSFDLTAAWNTNLSVVVIGFRGGFAVRTATFVVSTGGPTLETLNWSGIDSVRFVPSGGTNAGLGGFGIQFALDDLTVNEASPVPEPGSMTLLGIGALGLAGVVRRRLRS